nr:MAG TPA: hypothetical protein [Caudoviricetes sp.]
MFSGLRPFSLNGIESQLFLTTSYRAVTLQLHFLKTKIHLLSMSVMTMTMP